MPPVLRVIFDKFLETCRENKVVFYYKRDGVVEMYKYFSSFMDSQISRQHNARLKNKYLCLKKLGLRYLVKNKSYLIKYIR
jgi:membrane-bound lytic murein transglycosylase MltF